jgi:hypothetical protein
VMFLLGNLTIERLKTLFYAKKLKTFLYFCAINI